MEETADTKNDIRYVPCVSVQQAFGEGDPIKGEYAAF